MAQASSIAQVITAPTLQGIWLHAADNAEETSSNFLYGNTARTETIEVQGVAQRFIGRTYPVYDTGKFESQTLKLDVVIPMGEDEQTQVEWFRTAIRNRRTICYRDNRGRKHFVVLTAMNIQDANVGTMISFDADTIDYTEEV